MTLSAARLFSAALSIALSTNALATDMLFSGEVQRQVATSSGMPDCARPCPAQQPPDAHGVTRVCVSNAGGCQIADIKVLHDFLGTAPEDEIQHIASRTGEWNQLHFSDSVRPLLVYVHDGASASTLLYTRDGVDAIDASFARRVGGIDAGAIHPDADGRIPVTQLAQLMHP